MLYVKAEIANGVESQVLSSPYFQYVHPTSPQKKKKVHPTGRFAYHCTSAHIITLAYRCTAITLMVVVKFYSLRPIM